jgi:hypothetical protein
MGGHMKSHNGHGPNRAQSTGTQMDFMKMTGLSSELADFLADFMGNPEILFSMSDKKKNDIESQMDAILSKMIVIK